MSFASGSMFSRGMSRYAPFASPWYTAGLANAPFDYKVALQYAEFIWRHDGFLAPALERVIAYFLTDIVVRDSTNGSLSEDERKSIYKTLTENLHIINFLFRANVSRFCYGNAFISVIKKHRRMLICPRCGSTHRANIILDKQEQYNFKYVAEKVQFCGTCPACKKNVIFEVKDIPEDGPNSVYLKLWNPHLIDLSWDDYDESGIYYYRIEEQFAARIRKGDSQLLAHYPLGFLKAAAKRRLFKFDRGVIFHLKDTEPAGIRTNGWGIPRTITLYDVAYQHALIRKAIEQFNLDFLIPLRVITPAGSRNNPNGASFADPIAMVDMSDYKSDLDQMLREHRQDPLAIKTLAYPVEYQMLGGEAKNLVPLDMLKEHQSFYANAAKIPTGFFSMDLQMQSATPMLHLFESAWSEVPDSNNAFLRWLSEKLRMFLNWSAVEIKLERPSIITDLQNQGLLMQLMQGGQVSQSTGMRSFGLDYQYESRQKVEDEKYNTKILNKQQKEVEAEAMAGQLSAAQPQDQGGGAPPPDGGVAAPPPPPPGGGGAPVPGGGTTLSSGLVVPQMTGDPMKDADALLTALGDPRKPIAPSQITEAAGIIADQLFQSTNEQQRRELLKRLEYNKLETVAASISKALDKLNSQKPAGQFAQDGGGGGAPPA